MGKNGAEKLYEKTGNQEAEARILKALELYDQELEQYFETMDQEDLSFS